MFNKKRKVKDGELQQDARATLLEVSEKLFALHGFEAVSIRMIAKESSINIAMIAYYFGSKEGLYHTLLASKLPYTTNQLESIKNREDLNALGKIYAVIDIYVVRVFENRYFNKIMLRELSLSQRPESNIILGNGIKQNWEIIEHFIKEGVREGIFRDIDISMTMLSMFGTIFQMVNNTLVSSQILNETQDNLFVNPKYRERLTAHLKDLMKHHLLK